MYFITNIYLNIQDKISYIYYLIIYLHNYMTNRSVIIAIVKRIGPGKLLYFPVVFQEKT